MPLQCEEGNLEITSVPWDRCLCGRSRARQTPTHGLNAARSLFFKIKFYWHKPHPVINILSTLEFQQGVHGLQKSKIVTLRALQKFLQPLISVTGLWIIFPKAVVSSPKWVLCSVPFEGLSQILAPLQEFCFLSWATALPSPSRQTFSK